MTTRPSPNHHLAFVFPEAAQASGNTNTQSIEVEPKLVWTESSYYEEDECYVTNSEQIGAAMRDGRYIDIQLVGFPDNKREPTSQDQFMNLWCDEYFVIQPMPRNPIIDKLAPGIKWRGPVLIQTGFGGYGAPSKFCDMSVGDMKRIHKFFKSR